MSSKKDTLNDAKPVLNDRFMPKRGGILADLVTSLKSVNTSAKDAKANEASMDDNNGNRIWYNWLQSLTKKDKKKD